MILAGNIRPTDVGFVNGKPFVECLGVGLGAALYLLGEEIRSARLDKLINVVRRAYDYGHQDFALALDRSASDALKRNSTNQNHRLLRFLTRNQSSNLTLSAPMLTVSNGPYLEGTTPSPRNSAWMMGFSPFPFSVDIANFNSGGILPRSLSDVGSILRNQSPFVSQSSGLMARENCRFTSTVGRRKHFGHSTSSASRGHFAFFTSHASALLIASRARLLQEQRPSACYLTFARYL